MRITCSGADEVPPSARDRISPDNMNTQDGGSVPPEKPKPNIQRVKFKRRRGSSKNVSKRKENGETIIELMAHIITSVIKLKRKLGIGSKKKKEQQPKRRRK